MNGIDPNHALPLYHQIAEVLRGRIATGELRVGDGLEPMRRAAESFGVNLHTVRHAYLALSRDGLVAMNGARGTRVISDKVPALAPGDHEPSLAEFVQRIVREAKSRYRLTTAQLAARIADATATGPDRTPTISIVECSDWQCRRHAEELLDQWGVTALPHAIDEPRRPDADIVIATWFHYNDVRRRWPDLLHRVEFLTIRPDLSALASIDADSWWVVERDEATVGAVAGDLRAQLGDDAREIRTHITADAMAALRDLPGKDPILFPPRVFADLDETARNHQRAFELRYLFDATELSALASRHTWRARRAVTKDRSGKS